MGPRRNGKTRASLDSERNHALPLSPGWKKGRRALRRLSCLHQRPRKLILMDAGVPMEPQNEEDV